MADHDNGYKLLFSHAAMVADLIRGFVKEDWVRELDFDTLERVGGSYVSDDLRSRQSDVVWRIGYRGRWLYIYLLLEFQSTVDPFMGVRVMTYVGLLYQDLIRQKAFTPSGLLPPVFCLVLYNGKGPWYPALDVADLIEPVPGGLELYRPRLRYALIDETRVPEMELELERNLAAGLFRLEQSRTPESLRQEVRRLTAFFREPPDEDIRRSVTTWLTRVLLPARFPGQPIPEIRDLQEVDAVLEETVREWTREWKEEGWQKGLKEGRQKGLQEGLQEGRQEGRQEGLQEGRQEGLQEGSLKILLSLLEERFGTIPGEVLQRVKIIRDPDELERLAKRVLKATSLDDLGLG